MIELSGVGFTYRRRAPEVLCDLNLVLEPGRTVLLGPNGAGKSTILGLCAGVLVPVRGSVSIAGVLTGAGQRRRHRRGVAGWMPQDVRAYPGLSAREQVAYAGWLGGMSRRDAWQQASRALARVGLGEKEQVQSAHLSGGQLRRVGLAEAIVAEPQVLLLDEPTVGLDPAQRSTFREVLLGLDIADTIVVSTHQVDDLDELFDRVVVVDQGAPLFHGGTEQFLALSDAASARRAEAAYGRVLTGAAT